MHAIVYTILFYFYLQEEWVVCRLFHKNSTVKKSNATSSQPSDQVESISDAYTLPNFNIPAPHEGQIVNDISLHNYYTSQENMNIVNLDPLPSLLLYKAIQCRGNYNHQPMNIDPSINTVSYPYGIPSQDTIYPFGIDFNPTSNIWD